MDCHAAEARAHQQAMSGSKAREGGGDGHKRAQHRHASLVLRTVLLLDQLRSGRVAGWLVSSMWQPQRALNP